MPATSRPHETAARFWRSFGSGQVTRATAIDAGFTRGQLRAALDRGLLVAPRHGVLRLSSSSMVTSATAAASDGSDKSNPAQGTRTTPSSDVDHVTRHGELERDEHLDAVRAALLVAGEGAMASHGSAALVHRLARPSPAPERDVELVLPGAANWAGPGVVVRGSAVPDGVRVVVDGIPTTDLARTALDLARGQRLPGALVALDAASRLLIARQVGDGTAPLRRAVHDVGLREAAREQLADALSDCWGWPGTTVVRAALPLVEPAAESPLESRSRAWFLEARLPPLQVGVAIACEGRTYWADFADLGRRVIGEADGFAKYGTELTDVRERLVRERQRQSDLEAAGWRVVRWLSNEPRETVVRRMATALGLV